MDLSRWMEPDERFTAASLSWMDLHPDGEIVQTLAREAPESLATDLRIERCLGADDAAKQLEHPETLGVYCLSLAEGQAVHGLEKWARENPPPGRNEMLVSIRAIPAECVPDLLNPRAASRVIEVLRAVRPAAPSPQWVSLLPVHLERRAQRGDVIWTPEIPRLYQERWEEDITEYLPYLWFQGPGAPRFRRRFRALIADLFEAHFLKPLAAWCEEAGLAPVVRVAPDDSLCGQILDGWGIIQRFFEWTRIPGIANLRTSATPAFRQAASAIAQLHAPSDNLRKPDFPIGAQCDLYRNSHGPATLAEFSAAAEKHLAMGAAFLSVPDSGIPLRGDGKRLSSAAVFHRAQPWWPEFETLNQAIARLNDLLSQGRRVTNLLLLVPADSIESLAAAPLPENLTGITGKSREPNAEANEIQRQFHALLQALESYQIDYDLADEDTLERHGEPRANAFVVGKREYTTVVLPPAFTWRAGTLQKLHRYARKGGSLILVRPLAEHADLEPSKKLEEMAEEYPNIYMVERVGREVSAQANRLEPPCFRIKTKEGQNAENLLIRHRRTAIHDLFFIVNTSADQDVEARLFFYADGAVRLLDPWTPRIFVRETDEERNALAFDFSFHPGASALFAVGGEADLTEPPYQRAPRATASETLDTVWEFERTDPNLLPLGNCRWSLGEAELSQEMPVEFARAAIREQQPETGTPVTLVFAFEWEGSAEENRALKVILEPDEGMEAFFNGIALPLEAGDDLLDPEFLRGDMIPEIRIGTNEFLLRFPYTLDAVIETPILAGDFAVSKGAGTLPLLAPERKTLRNGPLSKQGYPYYAGRMRYRQRLTLEMHERNRYFIALQNPAASIASLKIGSHQPVPLHFPPYRIEITRIAQSGENDMEIEVVSSLRNLYGPVHLSPKLLDAPDFSHASYDERPFRDRQLWTRRPNLAPFGLLDGAVLEVFDPTAPPPTPPPDDTQEADTAQEEPGEENQHS